MTWQPGQRVVSEQDRAEWEQWRRESKRQAQRERRAKYRRIDYYPDDMAALAIDALVGPWAGGDYSSAINRIVGEWIEQKRRRNQRGG